MPGDGRKAFTVRLRADIAAALERAAAEGNRPCNVLINDAVVGYLGGWRAPGERIAEKHKRRRATTGVEAPSVFDPVRCHPSGWPNTMLLANVAVELRRYMREGGAENVRRKLMWAWEESGLGEYTDAHLRATLQWIEANQ